MKLSKIVRCSIVAMTCCGMLSAQFAHAAGTSAGAVPQVVQHPPAVRDVALQDQGELRGQVLDVAGIGQAAVPVAILRDGREIARTQTDPQGQFAVQGLTGGVYQVATPMGIGVYRAWSPRTAPPAAAQAVVVVPNDMVVRGQFGTGALGWLANPWVLAAIVAAAIAIPLALDDDDDAS